MKNAEVNPTKPVFLMVERTPVRAFYALILSYSQNLPLRLIKKVKAVKP